MELLECNSGTNRTLLDETDTVPESIQLQQLLQIRANEIQALETSIAQSTGTKMIFQRLPKHMRRRTMSHNMKRLPRRLHEAHLKQMLKSGLPPKQKRPSRRFRRRPTNLQLDYNRRKRKHMWLETHIWHAKRFHMTERWGYKLPERPCDKAFRACYRASSQHCLLQDISYYNCLELHGPEDLLISHLKLISNCSIGLSITALAFRKGAREGTVILFRKDSYPYGAIGEVKFIWKPINDVNNKQLWLWVHPAFYTELLNTFIELFNLEMSQVGTYFYNPNGIKLTEHNHNLNRFRLTGPLAHSVLLKVLNPVTENNQTEWFNQFLNSTNKIDFNEQIQFWNTLRKITTTSCLHPHMVLNLIVTDPRYSIPHKRTKAVVARKEEEEEFEDVPELCDGLKFGPIWCSQIRTNVSQNVASTAMIINQRKEKLVPDGTIPLDVSTVPIMLIQQPGNRDSTNHLGYCSGWDVILPLNWARPFWHSFIMWGARPGGIRESNLLQFERGLSDLLQPDTKSGKIEEQRLTELYKQKFFNLPPNKRPNYTKLGIVSPFSFRWKQLIHEWNLNSAETFYVMRDRNKLNLFKQLLRNKKMSYQNVGINFTDNCLIPVKLNILKRGRAGRYSIICLPNEEDLKKNKTGPVESQHKDANQRLRTTLRDAHRKLLKKLKRKRIRAKAKGNEIESNEELIKEQLIKMKSLWLPEPGNIRKSCSRQVFGFVTNGDFKLSTGNGSCVGYVALGALITLFQLKQRNIVLVRSISSRQYRLAQIEIVTTT